MIKAMLKAGYMEQNTFFKSAEGTPQGGILSPLLANVYLTAFDWTVGRMYQHPRQQTAYICSDRARLLYQGGQTEISCTLCGRLGNPHEQRTGSPQVSSLASKILYPQTEN